MKNSTKLFRNLICLIVLISITNLLKAQSLTLQLTPTNISCFGFQDGAVDLTVSGGTPPYSYAWSNDANTEDISDLPAGLYIVVVTDANLVTAEAEITLTQPEPIRIELTAYVYPNGAHISQYGACNGNITTVVDGGVAPYSYLWMPGLQTVSSPANLCAGDNILLVTDNNGCSNKERAILRQPERSDWQMSGNANTDPSSHFIGTSDNKSLIFKTNNNERSSISEIGQFKINDLAGSGERMVVADQNGVLKANQVPWVTLGNDNINSDYGNWPLQFIGTINDASFVIRTFNLERMRVNPRGSVGIGTANAIPYPNGTNNPAKLGINGSVVIGPVSYYSQQNTPTNGLWVEGKVGIGDTYIPANYKMAVNGKIICEEVFVKLRSAWPDYVFRPDYKLMPIKELKQFIRKHGHLPEIKSQSEVDNENGITLGENQTLLLKKIEELTLYIINQDDKINSQDKKIEQLQNQINQLLKK